MGIRVVAVDVGSAGPPSKFAWAAFEPPARESLICGSDPQAAVSAVVAGLAYGGQAALLLQSPLPVPVPAGQADGWRLPGKARAGERNRAWSAGVGAGVLATALAHGAWMLRQLAAAVPGMAATTQPDRWQASAAPLLLAEAFVSAADKHAPGPAGEDAADAEAAGLALVDLLGAGAPLASSTCCSPHAPFNLLAAMALWAGLTIDPDELNQDVLVLAARSG